ncbi:hypothetical protein CJ030_MR5G002860 [Morella rubra]|uniref:Uncharacterized protein n=1 Tax=Morella rubra TaxID=262757 RepID=A0A6A1VP12_9ROSI|nr:hypothetical protein CJ030_MR5G002860 [Morella rubra]
MGGCVSSQKAKSKARGDFGGEGEEPEAQGLGEPDCCDKQVSKTAKVIHMDGWLQEFKHPVQAQAVTSQNPNCFLCSYESLNIGTCAPQLAASEELQPGYIYFLMPLSYAHQPLSLPDLCSLAIKATSALRHNGVDFSFID